ncbi:MAG: ribonuclease Y [Planctomycetota bacterium]
MFCEALLAHVLTGNPSVGQSDTVGQLLIGVIALVVGVALGVVFARLVTGSTIKQAKDEAKRTIDAAEAEAKTKAEAIRLDAEKQALARKEQLETEAESARAELRDTERRLGKREDAIERKEEALERRETDAAGAEEALKAREVLATEREAEAAGLVEQQKTKLLQITDMTNEQAREEVLQRVEEESRLEVAKVVREVTEKAEAEAKEKAQEITLSAIQRYATEHTSESTVRSVAIPSDDMKGRIIGREGRNIRAIEKATGADIIVDDTPGVIVVSCFDKVRQAVAVESMERLIADGRMHPTRIEEIVAKVRSEIDEKVIKAGKDAVLECNLRGLNPKVIEAMGKLSYRTSYGQNVLRHSVEVAYLCQIIADQLGLSGRLARRCGFLHDIGKAMDHEMEGGHPKIGMDFCKQHGEKEEAVLNAIGGHHADIPATTFYTPIVMAADAVSSARPGARRESLERYVQRLNELQDIAMGHRGVEEAHAIQAGREVRVMVDANKVGDDEAFLIAHDIAKRVSEEMTFPGEIRVTVLRETRAIEVAR